jgi:hypothetical protein
MNDKKYNLLVSVIDDLSINQASMIFELGHKNSKTSHSLIDPRV